MKTVFQDKDSREVVVVLEPQPNEEMSSGLMKSPSRRKQHILAKVYNFI